MARHNALPSGTSTGQWALTWRVAANDTSPTSSRATNPIPTHPSSLTDVLALIFTHPLGALPYPWRGKTSSHRTSINVGRIAGILLSITLCKIKHKLVWLALVFKLHYIPTIPDMVGNVAYFTSVSSSISYHSSHKFSHPLFSLVGSRAKL